MRLALVQMRCEKGTVAVNIDRTIEFLNQAVGQGADVVCFPEMSLTGYVIPPIHPNGVIDWDDPDLSPLYEWSADNPTLSIIVGIVECNPDGKPFISQAVIRDGEVVASYRKINIVDSEAEMFSPGSETMLFEHDGTSIGILVCADQSREDLFERCADDGAEVILLPAAPGLFGPQATRDWQSGYDWWRNSCAEGIGEYARRLGVWIGSTSQSGRTVDEDFPGGGYVYDPKGKLVAETEDWLEGMIIQDVLVD